MEKKKIINILPSAVTNIGSRRVKSALSNVVSLIYICPQSGALKSSKIKTLQSMLKFVKSYIRSFGVFNERKRVETVWACCSDLSERKSPNLFRYEKWFDRPTELFTFLEGKKPSIGVYKLYKINRRMAIKISKCSVRLLNLKKGRRVLEAARKHLNRGLVGWVASSSPTWPNILQF